MSDTSPKNILDRQQYERTRRDFLDLCGRMSVSVPPAVMLLASSRVALASIGTPNGTSEESGDEKPTKGRSSHFRSKTRPYMRKSKKSKKSKNRR